MIALDTNLLIYAHREETPRHSESVRVLRGLAEGVEPWGLPWPCIYEFLRVVTHPRVFDPPTDLETAVEGVRSLLNSPSLVMLGEGRDHLGHLVTMMREGRATGNLAHDAHIAALVREHGVHEFWTTDRDFARFVGVRTHNPLAAG